MNFTQDVLFVLLIGLLAEATDTDLATNSTILLLILLFLSTNQSGSSQTSPCCSSNLGNGFSLTSFFPG